MNLPQVYPQGTDIDENIKNWFEVNGIPGRKLDIRRVNLCYNISPKMELLEEIEGLCLIRADMELRKSEGELVSDDEIAKINAEVEEKMEKVAVLSHEYKTGVSDKFVGECYITFNNNEGKFF